MEPDINHMQTVKRFHEDVRPVCYVYPSHFGGVLSVMHLSYLCML